MTSDHDPSLTLRQIIELSDEIAMLVSSRLRDDSDTNREFRRAVKDVFEPGLRSGDGLPVDWARKVQSDSVAPDHRDAERYDPWLRCRYARSFVECCRDERRS